MRSKHLSLIIIMLATMCSTTSCATILIGSRENITFNSNLPGDTPVRLMVDGEQIGNKVCFPITVTVRRGYSPSHAIAEAEGYEASTVTIRKKFHPAILANILIGGIIGASVDLGSGAVSQAEKKNYEFYFTKENYKNEPSNNQYIEKKEEQEYKIGDLYSDIGKRGVVVSVSEDGKHGKIISLRQEYRIWSKKSKCYISDSHNSGLVNLNALPTNADVPAMDWCRHQGYKWYLPAVNEMKAIYANIDIINESLQRYGGKKIYPEEMYWTSTESSKTEAIAIQSSYHAFVQKSESLLVVAMAEF
jgi:hypothetical protein